MYWCCYQAFLTVEKQRCKCRPRKEEPYGIGLKLGISICSHDLKQKQNFLALCTERARNNETSVAKSIAWHPDLGFSSKKKQGSMENKTVLGQGQGKCKVNLEHAIMQKVRNCSKTNRDMLKGHRSHLNGALSSKTWENLQTKIWIVKEMDNTLKKCPY